MTEAEWLACEDPLAMLQALGSGGGPRKRRLFSAAACRRVWHLLDDARSRQALELAERYADKGARLADLARAHEGARDAYRDTGAPAAHAALLEAAWGQAQGAPPTAVVLAPYVSAAEAVALATEPRMRTYAFWVEAAAERAAVYASLPPGEYERVPAAYLAERAALLLLVRCVYGNPFQPARLDRRRLTADVLALARAAYDQRQLPSGHLDPQRLAVLADALEEAGGAPADVLEHLRSPGPHVRGCFAVDLGLGRA